MKIKGLDIEIIRGETGSITYLLNNAYGEPLVLINEDMFDRLEIAFKVKSNAQTINTPYLIYKSLNINGFKRFDNETILDIRQYLVGIGTYDAFTWSGCVLTPPNTWPNQLFYHPGLDEYRYIEGGVWIDYEHEVVVSFDPVDTKDIPYGNYYYDLVLEAYNGSVAEYQNVLVEQHRFSVVYRV